MSQWIRHGSSNLTTLEHSPGNVSKWDDSDHEQVLTLASTLEHKKAQTLQEYTVQNMVIPKVQENEDVLGDQASSLGANNESSTETDIMDTKLFQRSYTFLGSSSSAKDVMVGQISAKYQVEESQEVGKRKREFELPDMNEMPPCAASDKVMENLSFSTSRTESLDMEHLHSQLIHVDKMMDENTPQVMDPSNRWVKRVKYSRSDDASYTENISTPLKKSMGNVRTVVESTLNKHLDTKCMELGKNLVLEKEQHEPALSHSWIRRWCHNVVGAPKIRLSGEQQRSNAALDASERRQPPSIAAMALLGKAMNGFRTCKFKNKGSFVVWSSGEI